MVHCNPSMESAMHPRQSGWIIFLVLFTSTAFSVTTQISSISPISGPAGTPVQINGSGFGATQSTSTVNFTGGAASVVSWSDTQITATVPATAVTGGVWVTVGGVSSNSSVYFNVPPPQITSLSPTSGGVGAQVTVTGTGFQATKGSSSYVAFDGFSAAIVRLLLPSLRAPGQAQFAFM
jgi:IPT/TIG domain-containing protein